MNVIETQDIVYEYPDGTKALENVNFKVDEGKIVALLGPNGAGKSTLFLHFNGILKPSSGKILFNGSPVDYNKKNLMEMCPEKAVFDYKNSIYRFISRFSGSD